MASDYSRNILKLTRTLAFKLFVVIVAVETAIVGAFTYAAIQVQQDSLMDDVDVSAVRVSDMIVRSARYSMLLNRKEDVHEIISSIGGEPGIEGLRIYNKQGEVMFGTVQSDLHAKVDMNAEACISCHASSVHDMPHAVGSQLSRIFTKPNGERVLGLITPIRNEAQCSDAACHAHPESKTILGVLDVKMSLTAVDQHIRESSFKLLVFSGGAVLIVGFVSGAFIWLFVRRPVKRLIVGMETVSSGRLDQPLEASSRDELGQLAKAFNDMIEELSRARKEITAWSTTLELKVKEKTADLEQAHKQMVKVEKMASLGNLASSVAHELNNPLEGILTFAKLLMKRIQKTTLPEDVIKSYYDDLKLVADEAQRCGNIVKNLLLFSRQRGMSFQTVQLRTVVERCILLVNHHAKMNNVRLESHCEGDDTIHCDPNQVQQVILALMMNAVEAMSPSPDRADGGVLSVDLLHKEGAGTLAIRVADNGMGMSEETKAHIFEPFFTTKSEGKGVGLGLAITYGIIERHHGTIDVESAPGKGTTFTVTLPTQPPTGADTSSASSSLAEGIAT